MLIIKKTKTRQKLTKIEQKRSKMSQN